MKLTELEQIARLEGLVKPTFDRNKIRDKDKEVRVLHTVFNLEDPDLLYSRPYVVTFRNTGLKLVGQLNMPAPVKRGRGRPRKV